MDEDKFHDLIMKELVRIHEKLDVQHERIDAIAQELVRIDTERKTKSVILDGIDDDSKFGWERVIGVLGIIGLTVGLIIGFI